MSDVVDIQMRLQETNDALNRATSILWREPNNVSAKFNVRSLEKRQRMLSAKLWLAAETAS